MAAKKKQTQASDGQREVPAGASDGLFTWLDAIFTKARPEGSPPTFMMHRFLASDRDFAEAARVLQHEVREPDLVFSIWQGLTPKMRGAPKLQYVVPKKPPQEEALITKMREVLGERRAVVEDLVALTAQAGQLSALYNEFGIEPPAGTVPEVS